MTPELAARIGRRAGDFEIEAAARRAVLEGLAASGVIDPDRVRAAVADYRRSATSIGRPTPAQPPATPAPN